LIAVLNILIELLDKEKIQEFTLADDTMKTNSYRFQKDLPFLRWYFKNFSPKIELSILIERRAPSNINELLQNYHNNVLIGHPGFFRMYTHIKEHYYWKNMKKDIQKFVQRCNLCQSQKIDRHPTRMELALTDIAEMPFEKVALDTIFLEETEDGFSKVITLQDNLTKFIKL